VSDTNLTPEQAVEKIGEMFNEKSASFSTKKELEETTTEMKSQIESLKGLEEKSVEIEKAIARFEGRLETFQEKAKVVTPDSKKMSLGAQMFKAYADSIDEIKNAVEKGGKINLETKDTTITNNYEGTYALTDFDTEVDRTVRKRYGILENSNTGSTTGKFVTYVQQTADSSVGWTAEGKPKTEGEPAWEEISEEVKKIASYVKVSKEMLEDLSFIRAEINNDLMLSVKEGIENALIAGVPGSINGLLDVGMGLPAFGAGPFALSVPNANITDLLRIVMAQIEAANFTPTHVIMNPQDIAELQITKGTDATYTYPMYLPTQDGLGEMRVAGMRVISSTYIAQDKYVVGDLSKLNIRFRDNIAMSVGLDQDDFTKNMVTILAEARLVSYVKKNQKPAFVVGTISTDVAAILKP
jgi:HK97 family phage major capsid protein